MLGVLVLVGTTKHAIRKKIKMMGFKAGALCVKLGDGEALILKWGFDLGGVVERLRLRYSCICFCLCLYLSRVILYNLFIMCYFYPSQYNMH